MVPATQTERLVNEAIHQTHFLKKNAQSQFGSDRINSFKYQDKHSIYVNILP